MGARILIRSSKCGLGKRAGPEPPCLLSVLFSPTQQCREVEMLCPHLRFAFAARILGMLAFATVAAPIVICEATAKPLAAIVEDVDPRISSVALMDYLEPGRTLVLGAQGWIEIGYFASCTREKVVGGVVRIGVDRSEVSGGQVDRRQVECDSENIAVPELQAERVAGSAQRGLAEFRRLCPSCRGPRAAAAQFDAAYRCLRRR